jgi:hypothetical protein
MKEEISWVYEQNFFVSNTSKNKKYNKLYLP